VLGDEQLASQLQDSVLVKPHQRSGKVPVEAQRGDIQQHQYGERIEEPLGSVQKVEGLVAKEGDVDIIT